MSFVFEFFIIRILRNIFNEIQENVLGNENFVLKLIDLECYLLFGFRSSIICNLLLINFDRFGFGKYFFFQWEQKNVNYNNYNVVIYISSGVFQMCVSFIFVFCYLRFSIFLGVDMMMIQ